MSGDEPLLVDPVAEVGSPVLAAALAAGDDAAIDRALREEFVVVPQVRATDGSAQVRVFLTGDPQHPYRLHLFSSASTFRAFLGADDEAREFVLVRVGSLEAFLVRWRESLVDIVFDAAGPATVTASVDDVMAAITGSSDLPEKAIGAEALVRPGQRVVALDLPLEGDWGIVRLSDPDERDADLRSLVERQLSGAPVAPALRSQIERSMLDTCRQAESAGGRLFAFLLQRSTLTDVAAPLSVTLYWNDFGRRDEVPHLDRVAALLRDDLGADDELLGADTAAGALIRCTRVIRGSADLGAADTPLLSVDYWLEFPDGRGLATVTFSTPQVDIREYWLRLTDTIVLAAQWRVEPAVDAVR